MHAQIMVRRRVLRYLVEQVAPDDRLAVRAAIADDLRRVGINLDEPEPPLRRQQAPPPVPVPPPGACALSASAWAIAAVSGV